MAAGPPPAQVAVIFLALKPSALNASSEAVELSLDRMPNSFTASPTLSKLNAPESSPLANKSNISLALKPNPLNWFEYSLTESSNSPDLSSPD
ncbi:hypothetical protein D3C71_1851730 [compost metagenome]